MENKNLSSALKEIPEDSVFNIKDYNTVDWDTMYVSKPYSYDCIKEKKITLPLYLDKKFADISFKSDDCCILIFVKDNTMVNYSIVPLVSTADFTFVDSLCQGLSSNTQYKIVPGRSSRKVIISN